MGTMTVLSSDINKLNNKVKHTLAVFWEECLFKFAFPLQLSANLLSA